MDKFKQSGQVDLRKSAHSSERAGWLNDACFYAELLNSPAPVSLNDAEKLATCHLEANSPLPLTTLHWGLVLSPDRKTILVYAACRERLTAEGHGDLANFTHRFPACLALILADNLPGSENAALLHRKTLTLLTRDPRHGFPTAIRSLALPDSNDLLHEARQKIESHLGEKAPANCPIYTIDEASTRLNARGLSYSVVPIDEADQPGTAHTINESDPAKLMAADVLPLAKKQARRHHNKESQNRWLGMIAASVALLLGLAGLATDTTLRYQTAQRQEAIQARQQQVAAVERDQYLLERLRQTAKEPLRPFVLLEKANTVRPKGVYYTTAVVDSQNRLTIQGFASSVEEVNYYTQALRETQGTRDANIRDSLSRGGRVRFTLDVEYPEAPESNTATQLARQTGRDTP